MSETRLSPEPFWSFWSTNMAFFEISFFSGDMYTLQRAMEGICCVAVDLKNIINIMLFCLLQHA